MFENFKAYDADCRLTEDFEDTIYLVILNEKGYDDIINWADEYHTEVSSIKDKRSCYYKYDIVIGEYIPIKEEEVPFKLAKVFSAYHNEEKIKINIMNTSQKFKIKIQLVNGTTIEPNLYSNDFHEIADVIQELSCEKLFAGQIKNIKIE